MRDRLAVFLGVCDGVSHAHRHLIVHRDLKPSNILVDASGQPKLLDFGMQSCSMKPETRRNHGAAAHANYASPEQLRGGIQTTATDVYSLAQFSIKLLTGRFTARIRHGPGRPST